MRKWKIEDGSQRLYVGRGLRLREHVAVIEDDRFGRNEHLYDGNGTGTRLRSEDMHFLSVLLALVAIVSWGQEPREGAPGDAKKLVKIRRIVVEGTRLPTLSVIRLAEIKAGDEVDFPKLQKALHKVTQTGLINSIDFEYESLPDKETDVILHLICTDAKPLAKASIQIPKVNEDDVWAWLSEQADPLFTRELPATEAAIGLYSRWITKYIEAHGEPTFQEKFAVTADAASSNGANVPDRLIFKVVKRRGVK